MSFLLNTVKSATTLWNRSPRLIGGAISRKVRSRLHGGRVTDWYSVVGAPTGRALIIHDPDPYFMRRGSWSFEAHQTNLQARMIGESLNRLGYIVDVVSSSDAEVQIKDPSQYDLLFGKGENFTRLGRALPDRVPKVYFVTGVHRTVHNRELSRRMDRLEASRGVRLTGRAVETMEIEEVADAIVLGGDETNALTYREHLGKSIPIHPVRFAFFDHEDAVDDKDIEAAKKNFLWFGGGGMITKGLDLTLEAFATGMEDCDLYVCGPLTENEAFVDIYRKELCAHSNVHPIGWVHIRSELFAEVTRKCGFHVYPTIPVGYPSGSIVNCMHRGMVPISTLVRPRDEEWGIPVRDDSVAGLRETLREASSLPAETLREKSVAASETAKSEFTERAFREDFETAILEIVDEKG